MATQTNTQIEELTDLISNLVEEIEVLQRHSLKSDLTGWNIVEAIENLSFELKRYNDGKGYEYKKF